MARDITKLPDRPKGQSMHYLVNALVFLRPYWKRVIAAFIALAITSAATLGLGQGVRSLIDNGFSDGDASAIDQALILLLGLSLIMSLGTFARFYLVSWLGERVVADLRQAVFDRVITLNSGFFEVTKVGEILSRVTTDTTLLQSIIGSSASMALRSALNFMGGLTMLFVTNSKLTALVLVVVPVVVVPILFFGRKVRKLSRESQDRVAGVGAFAEESFNAIHTVQVFTHEAEDSRRFAKEVDGAFTTAVRRIWARGLLTATVIMLTFSAVSAVLWVGGQDVVSGEISGGELAAFVFYATIVALSVGIISEVMGELQRAAGATERLLELLAARSDIEAPSNPVSLPEPAKGQIEFRDITFHYPSRPDLRKSVV